MLFSSKDKITKDYDVVIIGSGLAGMTAANILGRSGKRVLLLEAHNKLGGFATWFYKDKRKHTFDVSLHGFPYGMKKTCKKYWSKEISDHIVQLKDVRFINPEYEITSTFTKEDFTEKLVHHFKVKEETVSEFYHFIENINFYDDLKMTNLDLFQKFFPNRDDIIRFLMEPIVYANGSTLDDPAITYAIVFSNFMSKGVYTFSGGTEFIVGLMQEELLKNNVDIKKVTPVEKIEIKNGKVIGVHAKGDFIKTQVVLSNSNLKTTILEMAGEENFKTSFIEKVKNVRVNSSSCQVYIALKQGETITPIGDLIFTSTYPKFDTLALLSKDISSRTFSIYYPEGRPQDPIKRTTIVSSTNANFNDWAYLPEEEYKKEKEKMIEETIVSLQKLIPGIRDKIDYVGAATPRTVKKYTRHVNGSSFGTKFEGLDISMNLHKEVEGLFHAGSVGIIMSGWLGAANYGVIQSNNIESYLYSKENQ